jgi:hypothetical protein
MTAAINVQTREIPPDVVAVMHEVLAEAMPIARRRIPPGDGSLHHMGIERILGEGLWKGGWKIEATMYHDTRFGPGPEVHVHAYHEDNSTKGWLSQPIERSPEDELVVDRLRLAELRKYRSQLDEEVASAEARIAELEARVGA